MDPHISPEKSYRKLQTSQKPHQTNDGTTTTIFFQALELETPRLTTQNDKQKTSKPQDDW